MDPFEGTLLGECGRTELWIYTFILVIRLRKVKQSAIWFCTIFSRSCCLCRPWDTSANPPLLKWSCTEQPETSFYHKTGTVSPTLHSWIMEGLRLHAFRCGLLSFDGSLVRLNILNVHPIRMNLNSGLMPTCGCDRLPSLRGSNARFLGIKSLWTYCCFTSLHQLVPHLVPNYPPCPSVMCRCARVWNIWTDVTVRNTSS